MAGRSLVHVKVDLFEGFFIDLTGALTLYITWFGLFALLDELVDVLVGGREGQQGAEHGFKVASCDVVLALLVEEGEAFGSFSFAALLAQALEPVVGNDVLHELKVHCIALGDLGVGLFKLLLDLTRAHLVEPEVLEDVLEQMVGNVTFLFLVVAVEAVLEVAEHLHGQLLAQWLIAIAELSQVEHVTFLLHLLLGSVH